MGVDYDCDKANTHKAQFSDVIGAAIPLVIGLLKSTDYDVLSSAANALSKFVGHSAFFSLPRLGGN